MKKIILIFLTVLMIQPVMAVQTSTSVASTGPDHFAYKYCQELQNDEAVKAGTCSRLNAEISKGEFVKILLHVSAIGEYSDAQSIALDITDDFVRNAVNTAYEEGILSGEGGDATVSGAMKSLNRATAITIGGRAFTSIDQFIADSALSDLDDEEWYSVYAKKSVSAGVVIGKLRGGKRLFAADDVLSYGEALALAFQFFRADIAYGDWKALGNEGVPPLELIVGADPLEVYNSLPEAQPADNKEEEESISEEFSVISMPVNQSNIPAGANNVLFGSFQILGDDILQEVTLKRQGPGSETDFDQVYLFFGENNGKNTFLTRATNGKSIDSETQEITFFVNLPVNGDSFLEIRASLSQNASASSQHQFRILKIKTNRKVYEFDEDDPTKSTQFQTFSDAQIGNIIMRNNGSLGNIFPGTRRRITRWEIENDAAEAAFFSSITLKVSGVNATDMENFSLFESTGSRYLGFVEQANAFDSTFTIRVCGKHESEICEPLFLERGETKIFHVDADLTHVRQRQNIRISLDEPVDAVFIGATSGVGLSVDSDDYSTQVD